MKKRIAIIVSIVLTLAASALGGADNNPVSAGMTQSRGAGGLTFDAGFGNPALLGLDRRPRTTLSLMPTSLALWSDKLAPPFNEYMIPDFTKFSRNGYLEHYIALYLTSLFENSFPEIEGKSPGYVSNVLTNELRDGIGFYTGFRTTPIAFSTRGFAMNVKTYADAELRIPSGILQPFFSETSGLIANSELDFSQLSVDAVLASEIAVKLGFGLDIPFVRDYLKLNKGAAGAGVKLVIGHMLLKAESDKDSKVYYNPTTNRYEADMTVDVTSVGAFDDSWNFANPLSNPINGQGWGLDLGTVFTNDRHSVGIDVQNIGMIFWGDNIYKGKLRVANTDGFDLTDIVIDERRDSTFRRVDPVTGDSTGKYWPNFDKDLLDSAPAFVTYLPTALNIGYTYLYDFSAMEDVKYITSYLSGSVNYEQQIVLGPGRNTYDPRFSFGAATGLLSGYLPIRYGVILGGSEGLGSAFGFGIDLQYMSFDASYKAIGSAVMVSKKGFEAAAAFTFKGGYKDKFKPVKEPAPRPVPPPPPPPEPPVEEPPVPEVEALPPVEPVVVEVEVAAVEPEPEPELVPLPTVEEVEQLNTSQKAINFKTGSAELTASSYSALDDIAELLKKYPNIRYEIQGHTDSDGADRLNLLLSAARAGSVKTYLVRKGAPEASLAAIGYGKVRPVADNATVVGRALNRRVEFALIESDEEYIRLKALEADLEKNIIQQGIRRNY